MIELLLQLIFAATGITRDVDPNLTQLAQDRAAAIVCASPEFYNHTGKRDGVAEILVCFSDPDATAQQAIDSWMASSPHRAVLYTQTYTRIGCGLHRSAAGVMVACELTPGDVPNTATPFNAGWLTAIGVLLVTAASLVRKRRTH